MDIEDKIFGPFTFKEFVYLAGGGGLCFIFYKLLGLFWGAIPIIATAGFALMLTFYRPNNKPFINMLQAGFYYLLQSKLYIWKRRTSTITNNQLRITNEEDKMRVLSESKMRLSGSKLRDLAWSLDVLDLNKHQNEL